MDLLFEHFYLFIILPSIISFLYRKRKNQNKDFININGDIVTVNPTIETDYGFSSPVKLKLSKINRIQLAGNCLSFFNYSEHAEDFWLSKKYTQKVKQLILEKFPDIKFVEINS